MAYAVTNPIQRIGPQGYGNTIWYYVDGDALSVIDGADYFVLEVGRMKVGDIVLAVGNAVGGIAIVLTRSDTAIDLSNFAGQTTIDSD